MYDIKHILNISSSNSVHVYELLKAFEGIGKRTFELEELKEML
jgi:plasmid replication initiation protein